MMYYTNLLDSVLFESKFSGHNYVKLKKELLINNNIKEKYKDKMTAGGHDNAFIAEYVIGDLLPHLLSKSENNAQIIATLNQIADNRAILDDLDEETGRVDVIKVIKNMFNNNKLYISKYKIGEQEITVIPYIYRNLLSALYRITSPSNDKNEVEEIKFVSSLFTDLGHKSFTDARSKNKKIDCLLGSLSRNETFCNFKKSPPKEEYEFIAELNKIIIDFVENGNTGKILGYASGIKYLQKYESFSDEIKNNIKKVIEKNRKKDSKIYYYIFDNNFLYKLEKLYSIDKAVKNHTKDNLPFIKKYKYNTANSQIHNINENDNITVKTIKALLNNYELFNEKIKMFLSVFSNPKYSETFLNEVCNCVYNVLLKLCAINGGRSALIKEIDNVLKTILDSDSYAEINKYIIEEEKEKLKLKKNTAKKSLNFQISNGIIYITREMINCAYNICYCILSSEDKRMFEADGKLSNDGSGMIVWTITDIYDRNYDILDGKLVIDKDKEKKIL